MSRAKDITSDFIGLEKGTLLYSPLFDCPVGEQYNCKFLSAVEGERIVVSHNGLRYTFSSEGQFDEVQGRKIFLKKKR